MRAEEHARGLGHEGIGSEHLLLALLDDDRGPALAVLETMGLSQQDVRAALPAARPPALARAVHVPRPGVARGLDA